MSVTTRMTDLKLIDELLCDLKSETGKSWAEIEKHSSVTREAMQRLYDAWTMGEMQMITLSLAVYFQGR